MKARIVLKGLNPCTPISSTGDTFPAMHRECEAVEDPSLFCDVRIPRFALKQTNSMTPSDLDLTALNPKPESR